MWFAYGLMILIFLAAWLPGRFRVGSTITKVLIFAGVYVVHESLHLLVLTGIAGIVSCFVPGEPAVYLKYIAWINAFIEGSDIINMVLILFKPGNTFFYRVYYKQMQDDRAVRKGYDEKLIRNNT